MLHNTSAALSIKQQLRAHVVWYSLYGDCGTSAVSMAQLAKVKFAVHTDAMFLRQEVVQRRSRTPDRWPEMLSSAKTRNTCMIITMCKVLQCITFEFGTNPHNTD